MLNGANPHKSVQSGSGMINSTLVLYVTQLHVHVFENEPYGSVITTTAFVPLY